MKVHSTSAQPCPYQTSRCKTHDQLRHPEPLHGNTLQKQNNAMVDPSSTYMYSDAKDRGINILVLALYKLEGHHMRRGVNWCTAHSCK